MRSVFVGLRPLAATPAGTTQTKEISRRHKIVVSASGLVTITGGKWTTYRRMGQDTIDQAIALGQLPPATSRTAHLPIHGAAAPGAVADCARPLCRLRQRPAGPAPTAGRRPGAGPKSWMPGSNFCQAEVVWAARHELARTVEDVLARRVRLLFLDAAAAMRVAPAVAALLARELGHDAAWQARQVAAFEELARVYSLDS